MARSFLSAARLTQTATRLASTTNRRTFATAAKQSAEEKPAVATAAVLRKMNKTKPVEGVVDSPSTSWVPDPVTGYYRPGNHAAEVDPAEMRQRLLSRRH